MVRLLVVEEAVVAEQAGAVVLLVLALGTSLASSVTDVTELAISSQTAVSLPTRTRKLLL